MGLALGSVFQQPAKAFSCTRRLALAYIAGSLGEMVGCGGQTDIAGLSSGGTGAFSTGTVTGLGSIIVNGVRYNIDDAELRTLSNPLLLSSAVQLGMVVAIESSPIVPAASAQELPTATATRVTCLSGWVGPVASIARTAQQPTFDLLGYTIEVSPNTLFSGVVQQFSDLTIEHFAEVYGYLNAATGHILASRVNVSVQQPAQYKISSLLGQIDFNKVSDYLKKPLLNQEWINLIPPDISDDFMVQVSIEPNASAESWNVIDIAKFISQLNLLSIDKKYEVEIFGGVTKFSSSNQFFVNGIPVNAANAKITGNLSLGKQVKIKGGVDIQSVQIMATQVDEIEISKITESAFAFYGEISNVTVETFSIKGETIYHSHSADILAYAQAAHVMTRIKAYRDGANWNLIDVMIM